jgi:hypothetical protein
MDVEMVAWWDKMMAVLRDRKMVTRMVGLSVDWLAFQLVVGKDIE